jgi:hypothetical protein
MKLHRCSGQSYQFYDDCRSGEPFPFNNRRYKLHTVPWNPNTERLVVPYTFHAWDNDCDW